MVHYVLVVVVMVKLCYGILTMVNIYIHLKVVTRLIRYVFHRIVIGFVLVKEKAFEIFDIVFILVLSSSMWYIN